MAATITFESVEFASRMADLGFSARLPVGWVRHALPEEELDFTNPVTLAALAIVTAPHAAIVFAFAARPAYEDGTLLDWTRYLLEHNGLAPQTMGVAAMGAHPAMLGEATQPSELGPMKVRFAFFEDGGRLLNITLSAPEMLADAVYGAWTELTASFALETPRGATAAVQPAAEAPAAPGSFAPYALAGDAASLDPEHPVYAKLRESGADVTPEVVATMDGDKRAGIKAGAVQAQLDVPYGWHAVDDSRRTRIFDPAGQVRIDLSLAPREGRSYRAVLDAVEAQTRSDFVDAQFARMKVGTIHALGIRNVGDGDQYHMLTAGREQKTLFCARVTAAPDHGPRAVNVAELVMNSAAFDAYQQRDEPREPVDDQPKWWRLAEQLELAGRLEEAEQAITGNVPHIGAAASVAQLYQLRMERLLEAGDRAGALEAFHKADQWIVHYASMATSGGEGTALSRERDQFRAGLVSAWGSDPAAQ